MATSIDPVCGISVDPSRAAARTVHDDTTYYFCAAGCQKAFEATPDRYLGRPAADHGPSHHHGEHNRHEHHHHEQHDGCCGRCAH